MSVATPIIKRGHEYVHDLLRTHLLDVVLPVTFKLLTTRLSPLECYPVLVGGALVQRCAKRSSDAYWFIRDVLSEDVDIKFVITRDIKSNEDPIIPLIDSVRREFLYDVIHRLNDYVKNLQSNGLVITVQENQYLLNSQIEVVKRTRVFEVEVNYIEMNGPTSVRNTTMPMLDLGLYTSYSSPYYDKYRKLYPEVKLPIPTIKIKNVLYATCNYAYYDTVRMMVDRAKFFEEKRTMYALMKFSRYVLKFMCLYVMLHKKHIKNIDPKVIALYKKTHNILVSIDLAKLEDANKLRDRAYDTPYAVSIGKTLQQVVQVTQVSDLVSFIQQPVDTPPATSGGSKTPSRSPLKTAIKRIESLL